MNKSRSQTNKKRQPIDAPKSQVKTNTKQKKSWGSLKPRTARILTYTLGFIAVFAFLTWGYGDVLSRAEQESYVSCSPDTMHYLLSRSWGWLFYAMRWPLLLFKWTALGAFFMAIIYTLTARLIDYSLCLPRCLEGFGFLGVVAQLCWVVGRGTNLYFQTEPSVFILLAIAILLFFALLAGIVCLFRRKQHCEIIGCVRPYGLWILLLVACVGTWATRHFFENEIYTARMQLLSQEGRWEEMVELGRSAHQPTRAVAAYYACALEEMDQLAEGIFYIPFEFPKVKLDKDVDSGEYSIFLADCNYHAGLTNPAYRAAMDRIVMDGPRLYYLKRLALCALLNGEKELCRKYLTLIEKTPFEKDFVEKYSPLVENEKLILEDPELKHVLSLKPNDDHFEQNYMPPTFLGYNVGLSRGSDNTLITSAVACLYGKDLRAFLLRAEILAQKEKDFPMCMQQAIAILALKNPNILKKFPQVNRFVTNEITSFLLDAKPYVNDRLKVRHELRDNWLGTYVYYYYTENNDPDQVRKPENNEEKAGVN